MYIEVDLGEQRQVDAVTVLASEDTNAAQLELDLDDGSGRWSTVAARPMESTVPLEVNLRRLATEEVKWRGVEYLVIKDDEIGAKDYQQYAPEWGLKPISVVGASRLYKIQ